MSNVCCIFVSDFKKIKSMKKLSCFVCFGLLMITAIAAQPTRAVAQMQSDAVVLTDYAQPDFVDFVLVPCDMGMNTTTPEETHVSYDALFADCNVPVFDITLPVFRLCGEYSHNNTYKKKPLNCVTANNMRATARHVE